jgi:transposase InsO family protein
MAKHPRGDRRSLRTPEWPALDDPLLDDVGQALFRRRRDALQAYANGARIADIESAGVDRRTLRRLLQRALQPHPDGRLWGWRALAPHVRVKAYERRAAPKLLEHSKAGNAGAFGQLLARFPELQASLRQELASGVTLLPGSGNGRLKGVKAAAERFRGRCRALGLGARDYPLNQKDKAVRSLARTLRSWLADDVAPPAQTVGARVEAGSALRRAADPAALVAYDTVAFDIQRMDLRLEVVDVGPAGGERIREIERVWLLAIVDVATRCILGCKLSLARTCDRSDVVETIRRALVPQQPPVPTLRGLRLRPGGGYVSHSIAGTRYACWRQMRLDNARAHPAATSLDVLCETLGCTVEFAPARDPDDRRFIERFFATVTQTLSMRLPGTLPGPQGARAALARLLDPTDSPRLRVTAQELDELLAVTLWNHHGTPHPGLDGQTPLDVMRRQVMGDASAGIAPLRLRQLPLLMQQYPALLLDPVPCIVRANTAGRRQPHITYLHVRYTSAQLAASPALVGQHLRVHVDPQDLRQLTAVTHDGQVLEPLRAASIWGIEAHTLWMRREFFKAKRARA